MAGQLHSVATCESLRGASTDILSARLQSVDKLIFKWDTAWFKLDRVQEIADRTGKRPQMNTKCCGGTKVTR